ncbi:MAG: diacylglycerol kinase family protein [Solobacterium sp.]|nr:diacylglycerol kinase family protein [Solobacterium sp.]
MKKKFEDAFRGLYEAFMDPSVFLQAVLGIMAVIAGFILKLERTEWLMVILCIGLVITAEILNTCIEKLCDLYSTAYSERIRKIKDMSSGAVLFAALIALTAAVMILLNHI